MSDSPFTDYANATLRFEVASGALVTDPRTGNVKPGKAIVEVTALLDQAKPPQNETRPGVDSAAVYLEGFVVEVVGADDPLRLPAVVTPDSLCAATWDNKGGRFFLQLKGHSPWGYEAITGDEIRGYFQVSNFAVQGETWTPMEPVPTPVTGSYETTFVQAQLTIANILSVTHNLNTYPSAIAIWDETGEIVIPDAIEYVGANSIGVNLKSFAPIQGEWKISIGA